MKVHFISIGGAVMHNMAIAMKNKGHFVTGSDDEIFEPSRSKLAKYHLLPEKTGWFPEKITKDTDAVILGMHAKQDNPELKEAQKSGIRIYSFPEFLYEQTKNKKRLVIAGSHGKTTITSMVMKVLKDCNMKFDYMVGAGIEGFDTMVGFSEDSEIAIFEGDEYLSSAVDKKPKFLWYKPHAAVISGIAWDHANVFPDEKIYINQFENFIKSIEKGGKLFFYKNDHQLTKISELNTEISTFSYESANYTMENDKVILKTTSGNHELSVFGKHNIENIEAARLLCNEAGINDQDFYKSIKSFKGAQRRLELLYKKNKFYVYFDFAHAPSKVKATAEAVKEKHPESKLVACLELHTFSSLNKEFLPQYKNKLNNADKSFVYFNPEVVNNKNLPGLNKEFVKTCFGNNPQVYNSSKKLFADIAGEITENSVLLIMTSGSFDGIDIRAETKKML